jgi:MSHA pilin protein MshD
MMLTRRQRCRGFTLIEATISIVVVALMLGAALNTAGAARARQESNAARARAIWLAQSLMSEIMDKPYTDPNGGTILGIDTAEALTLRNSLDDVDDYNNVSESPPKNDDGTSMTEFQGWTRSVSVACVLSSDFRTTSATDTNYKRITVTVKKGQKVLATLTTLRTKARDSW